MSTNAFRGRDLMVTLVEAAEATQRDAPHWILQELTDINGITVVDDDGSARLMRSGGDLGIEISRTFLERTIRTPAELLFVVMHEVLHHIFGDLFRGEVDWPDSRARTCANIVADVRVNRWILVHTFPDGIDLLRRMYHAAHGAARLLLPPIEVARSLRQDGVSLPELPAQLTMEGLNEPDRVTAIWQAWSTTLGTANDKLDEQLGLLYTCLWTDNISFTGAYHHLLALDAALPEVRLLGTHPPELEDNLLPPYVRGLLARLIGAVGSSAPNESTLTPETPRLRMGKLARAIRHAIDTRRVGAWHRDVVIEPTPGIVPTVDRRSSFLLASGVWPVFFRQWESRPGLAEGAVRFYLDVSGSTAREQPLLYGLALELDDLIAAPIYLFSNKVVPISRDALQQGRCASTGGTDFDCVIRHALDHQFGKILIATDGCARLSRPLRQAAARAHLDIYVLGTGWRIDRSLLEVTRAVWMLNMFSGNERFRR